MSRKQITRAALKRKGPLGGPGEGRPMMHAKMAPVKKGRRKGIAPMPMAPAGNEGRKYLVGPAEWPGFKPPLRREMAESAKRQRRRRRKKREPKGKLKPFKPWHPPPLDKVRHEPSGGWHAYEAPGGGLSQTPGDRNPA